MEVNLTQQKNPIPKAAQHVLPLLNKIPQSAYTVLKRSVQDYADKYTGQ